MNNFMRVKALPGIRPMAAFAAIVLLLSSIYGCGYRPAATAGNRLDSNQNIWVAFIENTTISSTAQTVMRRALLEEAQIMRGIAPAASFESADLRLSGVLKSYTLGTVSYTAADRARQYRLAIEAELELRGGADNKLIWKGILRDVQEYPANADLALQQDAENAALVAASHKLARKFFITVEQSY